MAYQPPSIGPAGLTIALYPDILGDNLQAVLNIFGQNQYVGPDSALYQLISILSLKQADQNLGLQLVYNQSSPQTAVGAGLDRNVKMNGLARESFSFSTAVLTLTGTPGTPITNGFAQDQNGNLWALPSTVTITGGSINVTAICTTPGNIAAEPGTINIRSTPTSGWAAVTNADAAIAGNPVEADSQLRARQSISVALPSLTPIGATVAAVLATPGVIRVAPGIPTPGGPGSSIENPTGAADSWGNPAHSISIVAQGGTPLAVATAIYLKKTIGCFTNGTTSVVVTDPNTGFQETISYFQPNSVQICVLLSVQPLTGFTSATQAAIQTGIVNYLNSLAIGEEVVWSELFAAALTARTNPDQPTFSIRTLTSGAETAQTTANTTLGLNTIVVASAVDIVIGNTIVDQTNQAVFPSGTTVTNIAGTTITLSNPSSANGTGDTVGFFSMGTSDITLLFHDAAEGLIPNVNVTVL